MIDVSDGLSSDLLHLSRLSGTGCRIYYTRIPVDAETCRAAEEFNIDPLIPALNGGEDYELLFTLPLEYSEKIKSIRDITIIGHMTVPEQGYYMVSEGGTEIELKAQGWEKVMKIAYRDPRIIPLSDLRMNSSMYSLSDDGLISFSIKSSACETFIPF